jgi:hypothetical protein
MKKALLIGNGFTSNLIQSFKNEPMMKVFYKRAPEMIDRIEEKFSVFRDLDLTNSDLYNVTEALFCGDNLFCGTDIYASDDGIHIHESIRVCIIEKLKVLGFSEPEKTFKEYFENYGLVYSINYCEIIGVETYLKVVHMFMEIGDFTEEDYNNIKLIANEVYFNTGKHGIGAIDNPNIDVSKLAILITDFNDVYTTNYDTILDDLLEQQERFPYHLHGGFSINHLNKNPDGRYSPSEARLIWGINADSKYKELRVGLDFNNIDFNAFSFGDSQISEYFDYLNEREYEELHILGFSGENDDHINQRIKDNSSIKRITIYINPEKVNSLETQVRSRILFSNENKIVNLKSWDDFWNTIKKQP